MSSRRRSVENRSPSSVRSWSASGMRGSLWVRRSILVAALAALAGCATPVFKDAPPTVATPAEIAAAPERYHGLDVVWGGKIVDVRNLADSTEVQIVAYPLDGGAAAGPERADARDASWSRCRVMSSRSIFRPGDSSRCAAEIAGSRDALDRRARPAAAGRGRSERASLARQFPVRPAADAFQSSVSASEFTSRAARCACSSPSLACGRGLG